MDYCNIDRRQTLNNLACGFGGLALGALAHKNAIASNNTPKDFFHHRPKAKRVIFIFMAGGVSHLDSFDFKESLIKNDGKMMRFDDARTLAKTRKIINHRVMKPLWKFKKHGQSGRDVSELFPNIANHVDDLCFIKGMHTNGIAHGPSTLFLHTGNINLIRPSMGSWINYGLGTENDNLPGFVSIGPSMGNGGPRNFSNAFLPSSYQGTPLGRAGIPAKEATIKNLVNQNLNHQDNLEQFKLLQKINAEQLSNYPNNDKINSVINSYELAWRMQSNAPNVLDIKNESPSTLEMYGIGQKETNDFGQYCLKARKLSEAGVRYVQINYTDNTNNPAWDQHSNMPKHMDHARATDKPVAGLITDLKQRGLLEDTIVWWGSEFGRTPYAQDKGTGRDHNSDGFTVWLAGGGFKQGFSYGETDEFGHHAVEGKVHMHDLHATILHQLGIDHEKLTYRYDGRDFRLTDVHGKVVHQLLS
ncbi:MAG: sulfatase [Verrucomicrobiales bacterium]|nr:sulfatase [Verrucomicrobiales bacterium]